MKANWYASRTSPCATGPSPTVSGATPDELTTELAAATKAHQAALTAPVVMPEPPPTLPGWSGTTTPSRPRTRLFTE